MNNNILELFEELWATQRTSTNLKSLKKYIRTIVKDYSENLLTEKEYIVLEKKVGGF